MGIYEAEAISQAFHYGFSAGVAFAVVCVGLVVAANNRRRDP